MNRINYAENRPPKGGYATKERMGSLLLSLVLCLSFLPTTARAEDAHANHCICGASHTAVGDHTAETTETWTGISDLITITTGGYYYLTADVMLTSTWEPANGTVLCLNGHSIICDAGTNSSNNSGVDVIKVNYGGTLTITDCQNTVGKITHTSDKYGGGVYVYDGIFNLYGGSITNNTAKNTGGGVTIKTNNKNPGTFHMSGGSITIAIPYASPMRYDGTAKAAKLTNKLTTGEISPTITYTRDGNAFTGTPTDVGEYTASITLGDQTANVTYTITKATPTDTDFAFYAPSNLTYDASAKEVTVSSPKTAWAISR